jgi:hypothetical protein
VIGRGREDHSEGKEEAQKEEGVEKGNGTDQKIKRLRGFGADQGVRGMDPSIGQVAQGLQV